MKLNINIMISETVGKLSKNKHNWFQAHWLRFRIPVLIEHSSEEKRYVFQSFSFPDFIYAQTYDL